MDRKTTARNTSAKQRSRSQKTLAASPPHEAHYLSGTHWDREWYRPFEEYRILLVDVMDLVLNLLEQDPDFKYFHLDGQTCMLEDYLQIRPENRARLGAVVRDGRLLIGPWFTMPDLFCVGDEALIRNLMQGRRISRAWGVEPMPVGYTCDMFGHPSQMPQIYHGFDIPFCVVGRGTNEATYPAFFWWRAPNGSRTFAFKVQDEWGYAAFSQARRIVEKEVGPPSAAERREAQATVKAFIEHEMQRSDNRALCLVDAGDHCPPTTRLKEYLDMVRQAVPGLRVRHSTLPAFFAAAQATATTVPEHCGELREPAQGQHMYLQLIPNCVSARIRIKQANDACQVLLTRWAEPFAAMLPTAQRQTAQRFLQQAWEQLLLNQAHDSICGCSIDQVHRDMMTRFDQVRVLGEQVRNRALGALTARCAERGREPGEFTLMVANPVARARKAVCVFDVDIPQSFPTEFQEGYRSQLLKMFTLWAPDGSPIPYQRLGLRRKVLERTRCARVGVANSPALDQGAGLDRFTVAAELELPALGFTALLVKPSPAPVRSLGSLRTAPMAAENAHLALAVAADGTLSMTHKAAGQTYHGLLQFEDRSEIGDGWFHSETVNDEIVLSTAAPTRVSVAHDGPLLVTFLIEQTLAVPRCYDWHRESRAAERCPLRIVNRVTLRRDAQMVEVETEISNQAEDHRVQLLLPSGAEQAQTYLAHHPFDLVERPIALDIRTANWRECELAEKPFLDLQAVGDQTRGLAFLSAGGLHEGGVRDDRRRTLLVTLLRSFRRTPFMNEEPDGLELGRLSYRYGLFPYAGPLPRPQVFAQLAVLQAGLWTRQSGACRSGYPALTGTAAPTQRLLEQRTGRLILSAVKPAESGDGLVLRLWNPTGRAASETLVFAEPVAAAHRLALSESPAVGPAPHVQGATVRLSAPPHGIVTLHVRLGQKKGPKKSSKSGLTIKYQSV